LMLRIETLNQEDDGRGDRWVRCDCRLVGKYTSMTLRLRLSVLKVFAHVAEARRRITKALPHRGNNLRPLPGVETCWRRPGGSPVSL
jgi:hypothetical protein